MTGSTHRTIAAATILLSSLLLDPHQDVTGSAPAFRASALPLLLGAALVGAALPDLDIRYLRRHPWTGKLFPHRGFSHSLAALGLIGGACYVLLALLGLADTGAAFLLGWASHLAADALTPGGIALLWPARSRLMKVNNLTRYILARI